MCGPERHNRLSEKSRSDREESRLFAYMARPILTRIWPELEHYLARRSLFCAGFDRRNCSVPNGAVPTGAGHCIGAIFRRASEWSWRLADPDWVPGCDLPS